MTQQSDATDLFEFGRACLAGFIQEFETYGIYADPGIEVRKGSGMLCYYDFKDRNIYLSLPEQKDPAGKLHLLFLRSLLRCEHNDDLIRFLRLFVPQIIAHELAHHFRHRYGLFTANLWEEEQIANQLALAVTKHRLSPDQREYARRALRRALDGLSEKMEWKHSGTDSYYNILHALNASGQIKDDADDLGLLLRLYRYSTDQEAHRQILQQPLSWLHQQRRPSGALPVWFAQVEPAGPGAPDQRASQATVLWGDDCVTVEANLLRGLLDYDPATYQAIVERSAHAICDRLLRVGLGANRYYVPLYSLWILRELLAALASRLGLPDAADSFAPGAQEPAQDLASKISLVSAWLSQRVAVEAQRSSLTPQDAAFLTLACLLPGSESTVDPRWIALLLQEQRYDGSWKQGPLFVTGTHGSRSTWYSSCLLTSAYCYHALRRYQANDKENRRLGTETARLSA